jgi:hypothetical protein
MSREVYIAWQDIRQRKVGDCMDSILRDIELWGKAKANATLEGKSMQEVIFEGLKWTQPPVSHV